MGVRIIIVFFNSKISLTFLYINVFNCKFYDNVVLSLKLLVCHTFTMEFYHTLVFSNILYLEVFNDNNIFFVVIKWRCMFALFVFMQEKTQNQSTGTCIYVLIPRYWIKCLLYMFSVISFWIWRFVNNFESTCTR